ncbi:MAG TPA: hypothetical protein VE174_14330, partial [Actinomycetota bacterium]|nr:hypothetical protein [Actinomycetota bacterium]
MKKFFSLLTVAALGVSLAPAALAQVPQGDPTDLPVFSKQVPAGGGSTTEVPGPAPVAKTIDGNISDWVGTPTRYGGTSVYSAGEFVYQDHIFDATGPDDGRDAERLGTTDPLEEVFPEAYRLDALSQANAAGELGIPVEDVAPQYSWDDTYGDASPRQDAADLEEVRVAVDGDSVDLLARTTTMNTKNDTALLVLADTVPGVTSHEVPFNSGLTTTTGDVAFFVTDGTTLVADLATGDVSPAGGSAVAKPDSWTNALEASLPLASMSGTDGISLALASGTPNDDDSGFKHLTIEFSDAEAHPNVANVAFRTSEPVRIWFDRDQALALHSGSIDGFFTSLDTGLLAAGTSQEYVPGPGYHDRIFVS